MVEVKSTLKNPQESFSRERILEALKSLHGEETQVEYKRELKHMLELNQHFRSIESLYANLYSRLTNLAKKMKERHPIVNEINIKKG